ncbi:MAG: transketolase [Spirochaetales bacterium]|nr:transketolase [Spirochaetales bacterium]
MSEVKKVIDKEAIGQIALSIRTLSMDAIQKANSGHPGLPLGCAELGATIFAEILSYYPEDPDWIDRDRFILSAGHGSMLLYSLLHLSGYELSIDDLKNFRQLGSNTPGHPEYGRTPGVETTTGPLGQGVSNAVGMAIAEKMLSARFNTDTHKIIDHFTYVLASDGDMMEGVTAESVSLAGHLGLGKLILYYDSNSITIEGSTDLAFSEDVAQRFKGYNWHVQKGSAYDIQGIITMTENAKEEKTKPSLIILDSIIAKGAAHMEGSHKSHGAPLGDKEIGDTKKVLGVPEDSSFFVHPGAYDYFKNRKKSQKQRYDGWKEQFNAWKKANPELSHLWNQFFGPVDLTGLVSPEFKQGDALATRSASGQVINAIAPVVPNFIGGSADLSPSNNTSIKNAEDFLHNSPHGRIMHFGIREHAMGGIMNGMALHGGIRPFGATFLIFSDYMRPAIRLASLMKLPVIYVFTHDSVYVGEDGPTHQPVEQLTALRIIPNLLVLRPGDAQETFLAWKMALQHKDGPTALILTRQNLEVYKKDDTQWKENITRGAYIVKDTKQNPDLVMIASGSEVNLALSAASKRPDLSIRVISVLSQSRFLKQTKEFKDTLLPPEAKRICIEAGIGMSWEKFTRESDQIISIEHFGDSGPGEKVADYCGMNEEAVLKAIDNIS